MQQEEEGPTMPLLKSNTTVSSSTDGGTSLRCGWLGYRPDWLQRFNTPRGVLVCLCVAAAIQGMTQMGFVNVCLTTIEKRFHLKSQDTGTIAGAFNIAFVAVCLPVSFLASRPTASKPRWLGWGLVVMGVGSFVYALPHFLAQQRYRQFEDNAQHDVSNSSILCAKNSSRSICPNTPEEGSTENFMLYFIAGQVLQGIGSTPIYVLGMIYIDESVPPDISALYIGVFSAMFVGGAATGFAIGSSLLKIYIDWPRVDPATIGLNPDNELWLGCWWICFIGAGFASLLVAVAIMAYPRKLPRQVSVTDTQSVASNSYFYVENTPVDSEVDDTSLVSFLRELRAIFKNRTFMYLTLAEAGPSFLGSGLGAFVPKLVENQFNLSASTAALYVGFAAVPAGCLGSYFGGWFLKKFNLNCRQCLATCVWGAVFLFLSSFAFMVHCDNPDFDGITVSNDKIPKQLPNLESDCNSACGCDGVSYNPVCGANSVVYYSPCHAGCSKIQMINGKEVFQDCTCVTFQKHGGYHSKLRGGLKKEMVHLGMDSITKFVGVEHEDNKYELSTLSPIIKSTEFINSTGKMNDFMTSQNSRLIDKNDKVTTSNNILNELVSRPTRSPRLGKVQSGLSPLNGTVAVLDKCPSDCRMLPIFLGIFVILTFLGFSLSMPSVSAGLRCVEDQQKAMAFGLRAQITRLIGGISGPIAFGAFIDKTCLHWEQSCDDPGSCAVYELKSMNETVMYLSLVSRGLDLIFYVLAWRYFVSNPPRLKTRISVDQSSQQRLLHEGSQGDNEGVRHR